MTAAFVLILKTFPGQLEVKTLLLLAGILGGWSIYELGLRSQILTVFFLSAELFILGQAVRQPRWLWTLPFLLIIWTNTHPGFFLGPAVFGLYLMDNRLTRKNIIIFLVTFLATLLNPYGWRVYEEVLRHLQVPMNTLIAEWVGPDIKHVVIIVSGCLLLLFGHVKQKLRPTYIFWLALIFGYMAITARRNLPLYYLVLPIGLINILPKISEEILKIIIFPVLFFAFLLSLGNALATTKNSWQPISSYPRQAIEYFNNRSGNVFNVYEWGGFLIWKLPNMKMFVDGRMPAWKTESGKSPYTIYLEIVQTQPGWNETLAKYQTDYIFMAPGTFLDLVLEKNKGLEFGWKEDYRDQTAVIYRKI